MTLEQAVEQRAEAIMKSSAASKAAWARRRRGQAGKSGKGKVGTRAHRTLAARAIKAVRAGVRSGAGGGLGGHSAGRGIKAFNRSKQKVQAMLAGLSKRGIQTLVEKRADRILKQALAGSGYTVAKSGADLNIEDRVVARAHELMGNLLEETPVTKAVNLSDVARRAALKIWAARRGRSKRSAKAIRTSKGKGGSREVKSVKGFKTKISIGAWRKSNKARQAKVQSAAGSKAAASKKAYIDKWKGVNLKALMS